MRFLSIRFQHNILLDLLRLTCVFLIQAYTHDARGRKKILAKAEMEIEVRERKETLQRRKVVFRLFGGPKQGLSGS